MLRDSLSRDPEHRSYGGGLEPYRSGFRPPQGAGSRLGRGSPNGEVSPRFRETYGPDFKWLTMALEPKGRVQSVRISPGWMRARLPRHPGAGLFRGPFLGFPGESCTKPPMPSSSPSPGGPAIAVVGLVAIVLLWLSLRLRRSERLLRDLPTSKVQGVFIGLVELSVTAESERPFTAQISGRPCVQYAYRVEEQWSRTVTETTPTTGARARHARGWRRDGRRYRAAGSLKPSTARTIPGWSSSGRRAQRWSRHPFRPDRPGGTRSTLERRPRWGFPTPRAAGALSSTAFPSTPRSLSSARPGSARTSWPRNRGQQ